MAIPPGATKISVGIWRLPKRAGYVIRAKAGTHATETRFDPADPEAADLRTLKHWRQKEQTRLRGLAARAPGRGTLARDAARYLDEHTHLVSHSSRSAEVNAWCARLGDIRRRRITSAHVRQAVTAWHAAGVAPKTIANRLHTLRRVYRALDGEDAPTPADGIRGPAIHRTPPVRIGPEIVRAVVAGLIAKEQAGVRDAKTRARFLILATTGRRPSEIMRAEPNDVDLEARVWRPRDGKGGWSPGIVLNNEMLDAWRLFITSAAWGKFRTNSHAEALRAAGWPAGVRPYNLRHTVGITLTELGVDLRDVAELLGHTRLETTRRIYAPVQHSRQAHVSALLDGRFGLMGDEIGSKDDKAPG